MERALREMLEKRIRKRPLGFSPFVACVIESPLDVEYMVFFFLKTLAGMLGRVVLVKKNGHAHTGLGPTSRLWWLCCTVHSDRGVELTSDVWSCCFGSWLPMQHQLFSTYFSTDRA